MKRLLLPLVTSILMLSTSLVYADSLKIGVVDSDQVLQKSSLMVSFNDALNTKFKPRQDEVNNAQKQLQDEVNQLNYASATMSPDEKTKLQNKIIQDKANVQILSASFDRDINLAKNQDLQTFMTKFNSVISKIAQDGHYDIIEQRSNLIYVNSAIDITQQVLQQLTSSAS